MADLQIRYHPEVIRRDISRLDPPIRKRIKLAIEQRLLTAGRPAITATSRTLIASP